MVSRAWMWLQVLTLARVPLALATAVLLLMFGPSLSIVLICTAILLVGELTDALDGFVARRFGLASELGAMLDPWADSISRLVVYWSLASSGLALMLVPLVMAVRDITVSYCRIIWVRKGLSVGARLSGKIKAIVQAVVSFALLLGPLYSATAPSWIKDLLCWLVIIVTAISGIDYLVATFRAGNKSDGGT